MKKTKDLTASELGCHAETAFLLAGRHQTVARLVYHALTKDPFEPRAIRALSDFLCGDLLNESGYEQFSAAVLEFALQPTSPIAPEERRVLDDHLFAAKWSWAFAKKRNGEPTASMAELQDRSLFVIDETGYQDFLDGVVGRCGSLDAAFRVGHTISGALGLLLAHKTKGNAAREEDFFFPQEFSPTPEYGAWLESDAAEFEAMEKAREKLPAREDSF